ncbi:hypothetical protein JCM12856_13550 [Spirochaeta dissipatitropha]
MSEPELEHHEGNLAMVIVQDWRPDSELHFSRAPESTLQTEPVEIIDGQTLFQTASISKWLTAIGALKLVADQQTDQQTNQQANGEIDLDGPVLHLIPPQFLPRSLEPEHYSPDDISLRMLLSHTAGLTDNLGYLGFTDENTQSLRESLIHADDAKEGSSAVIEIGRRPGSNWQYSGGGYALLELIIETLSGEDFDSYMRREILQPLGMHNARFRYENNDSTESVGHAELAELESRQPVPPLALHFAPDGSIHPHRTFAAASASSLYAGTDDLTAFLASLQPGAALDQLIGSELRREMFRNQVKIAGLNGYGLGVMQYRPFTSRDPVIGHDGNNWPGISTSVRIRPQSGAGIIILSSGNPDLAANIASAWQQQETGWLDSLGLMKRLSSPGWIISFLAIYLLLLILMKAAARRHDRRQSGP